VDEFQRYSVWAALSLLALAFCLSNVGAAEPISVKNYGASGDGRSDDTEAIVRAVNAGINKAVYFPAGTYKISRPVVLPTGSIHVYGHGDTSVIVQTANNIGVFSVPAGSSGVEIDHLKLLETGTVHGHQLGRGAIFINPGGGAAVSNVEIHDNILHCASTTCISAVHLVNSRIHSNFLDNDGTGEHGIYLSSHEEGYSERVTIDSNVFHSDYRGKQGGGGIEMAIQIRAAKDAVITNNHITGWSNGILTIPEEGTVGRDPNVRRLIVRNNTVTSTGEDCFVNFAGTLSEAIVERNKFESCGRNGIRSNAPLENSIFEANRIEGSGEAGIRLNNVTQCAFVGNIIADSGSHSPHDDADRSAGIRLANGNRDNLLIRNTSNLSQGGAPQFGLSIGGTTAHVINPGNCFDSNTFSLDPQRSMDAAKFRSECSDMNKPIQVQLQRVSLSVGGGRSELAVTNPNRIPIRIVDFEPTGAVSANSRDCWHLVPSGSTCKIGLASSPTGAGASGIDQVTITYDNGFGQHTLEIPAGAQ
jgi:hypothetical protein